MADPDPQLHNRFRGDNGAALGRWVQGSTPAN
jgi:hypothetical protein